jgi:hypothetical protein
MEMLLDSNKAREIAERITNAQVSSLIRDARSPDANLVGLMAARDPEGYSSPRLDRRKAILAAQLQANMLRAMQDGRFKAAMNNECRDLFRKNGLLYSQRAKAQGVEVPGWVQDTTTGSDIATVATTALPVITRAISENPIFDLVETFVTETEKVSIAYFDVLYGSSGGAYSAGSRVDINDDATYSDRIDCVTAGKELNMRVAREESTVQEKVLGGKICITAEQNARQWGLSLQEKLAEWILRLHRREWGRLVTNDLRAMAGNTGSWSATAPAPYSSLNTNEWRKVLLETCVTVDAAVRADVYEPTEWMLTDTVTSAILERIQRFYAPMPIGNPMVSTTAQVVGEFGAVIDRWRHYADPYFAANTILLGRRNFTLVPNAPYYFIPFMWAQDIAMLFYPLTQILEMAAQSRAARKMIEPNAYGRVDITS